MEKKPEQAATASSCNSENQKHHKGILKNKDSLNSTNSTEYNSERRKSQKWDEMNILATYHPPHKDYGFMKINEPETPFIRYGFLNRTHYSRLKDDGTEEGTSTMKASRGQDFLTPEALAERLAVMDGIPAKIFQASDSPSRISFVEEELSPEAKAEALQFLKKRKAHYDEGKYLRMKWQNEQNEDNNPTKEESGTVPVKHTKKKDSRGESSRMSDAFKDEIHLHCIQKLMEQEKRQEAPETSKDRAQLTPKCLEPTYLKAATSFKACTSQTKIPAWYNWFRIKGVRSGKKRRTRRGRRRREEAGGRGEAGPPAGAANPGYRLSRSLQLSLLGGEQGRQRQ
ncbi:protein phosphatase inhibitor 2-like isoform X3 [Rhinatrema bivittatum]|uniref:protein phosphatase inhibitor 2-like isoform X3 n=1 Tax=Rhinatrema bivittatum TaxID=194408 RepID=UPI001127DA32|nr:protein phosphatase inhibitor 2-like isoform X3 [Rhinatrema bivittatum]